ncbi:MAG: hypothetical protein MZW92_81930 [Comamonadaceae bacterium]|nr:hypothetical protein [Comamonadaceae bacterium]
MVRLRLMVPADGPSTARVRRASLAEGGPAVPARRHHHAWWSCCIWAQNIKAGRTLTVLAEKDGDSGRLREPAQRPGELAAPPRRAAHPGRAGLPRPGARPRARARDLRHRARAGHREDRGADARRPSSRPIALVKRAGFRQEAVLHGFVIDRDGRKNDLRRDDPRRRQPLADRQAQ